jgi:XTP/dITP diphosphohydrolase
MREIRWLLSGVRQSLITLADLPFVPEPEESGATFAANARLKAGYYARASGLTTVAEDSGLAIDALGGRPGIHSARYPGATYDEKFAGLFGELAEHQRPWRARFICAIAVVRPQASGTRHQAPGTSPQATGIRHQREPLVPGASGLVPDSDTVLFATVGAVEGEIVPHPRGTNGFGYDPIFFYPPYGGTLAEQDDARKLAVAHRGRAFRELKEWMLRGDKEEVGSRK